MRTARLVCARTVSGALSCLSTGAAAALFLCVSTIRFALRLGEGSALPPEALWAAAAVPVLPFLACVLTMRLWTRERETRAMELLLCAPVPASSLVRGKFLGAWSITLAAIALYAAVPNLILPFFSDDRGVSIASCAPALAALALQSAVWCAIGSFASALCRHAASAGAATLLATVCLPYAAYRAALAWLPEVRSRVSGLPPVEHAIDISTGLVSLAAAGGCAAFTLAALEASVQSVEAFRAAGRGTRSVRLARHAASLLSFVLAALFTLVLHRAGMTWEFPERGKDAPSVRLRRACESAAGKIEAVCFMSRNDPLHRAAARLMRGIEIAAGSCGADIETRFADPNWDAGDSMALVADGVREGSIVFSGGRRRVAVAAEELFPPSSAWTRADALRAESICASAISSLRPRSGRNVIYAVTGHGEASFSDQGPWGMSRLARWLGYDGFEVRPLDLSAVPAVPVDCRLLAVAGARERFSEAETAKLDSYMRGGGRLLATVLPRPGAGAAPYLRKWGCKVTRLVAVTPPPLAGTDVKASLDGLHPVTARLGGSSLFFDHAAVLENEPQAGAEPGRTEFSPLASSAPECWGESNEADRPWQHDRTEPGGPLVLAAALERGGKASADVGISPSRAVVVGDASFALNASLERRGNANLDFMLDAVRWLAGAELPPEEPPAPAPGEGMTRRALAGFLASAGIAFPLAVFAAAALRARRPGRGRRR